MENNNTLGLIFSENSEVNLGELMRVRSLAAVPVGGRYRIIDFMLSNMVNSGIVNVGVCTGYKNQSLLDHVGSGRAWDLSRKETGLFLLPPPEAQESGGRIAGGIDYLSGALRYLNRSRQDYVLVSDCNTICNIDLEKVFEFHFEKDADITVVYTEAPNLSPKELERHILLDVEEDGRVSDIQVYPKRQKTDCSYMHMFYMKKSLLIEMIEDCLAHDEHMISKNILLANVKKLSIFAYKFEGYKCKIDNIKSFYKFNLELLEPEVREELFGKCDGKNIYTKVKDSVPTKYGRDAEVKNSFIADGCEIEGKVENCIVFRGVKIGKGTVVKNAIIMQKSQIMDNCTVENAIFDKEVILMGGKSLVGESTYPLVIGKKTVV
ncbi:MAG: glucose-1-phosphate adenylyltransferase subunit GlgD [Ruminococcaceae bacterium]|nr:glucose-1-phosphate adenylyltransferase subunit GlgD [Oscillospiraceae bacterium]